MVVQVVVQAVVQKSELRRRVVRNTEVQDLARVVQVAKGRRHFVRIHKRVGAMDEQEVDVIGAECAQRLFHRRDQVIG